MKLNIIVNGSNEIGLGHIYRCIAIADFFKTKQISTNFYLPKSSFSHLIENYLIILIDNLIWEKPSDNKEFWLDQFDKNDIVLFDLIESEFLKFKFLDRFNLYIYSISLFIYKAKNYFGRISILPGCEKLQLNYSKTKVMSGKSFIILRENIINCKRENFIKIEDSVKCLITMGGSDPKDLSLLAIKILKKIKLNLKVYIILGPAFEKKYENKIINSISLLPNFKYFKNVKDMSKFYSKIDFALINGGNTRYELSYLQIPYFCISIHNIQNKISNDVIEEFGGVCLGIYNKLSIGKSVDTINFHLSKNKKMKEIMEKMGNANYLAFGTKNIYSIIMKDYLFEKNNKN